MENNRGKLKKEELNLVEENSTELNSVEESKKTILVVDDEKPIVDILTYNLQKEGYATLEANDGEEAIRIATEQKPDLILLDIMLPKIDGLTVCKKLRHTLNVPILILSAKDEEIDKILGLELGADDYMVKPIDMEELLLRVKVLLKRANAANEKKLIIGNLVLDYKQMSVTYKGKNYQLTQKEFLLLYKFLSTPDTIFTRQELIEEIWGLDNESDFRTVDVHIKRIREKLSDIKEFEILTIRGIGYKAIITKNNL